MSQTVYHLFITLKEWAEGNRAHVAPEAHDDEDELPPDELHKGVHAVTINLYADDTNDATVRVMAIDVARGADVLNSVCRRVEKMLQKGVWE